jgi:hypothetical protein
LRSAVADMHPPATFIMSPAEDAAIVMKHNDAGKNFQRYGEKFLKAVYGETAGASAVDSTAARWSGTPNRRCGGRLFRRISLCQSAGRPPYL